jgi:crossover junction endodeoxyribonuclease RuvC
MGNTDLTARRVLGIDPALGNTGYGVIQVQGSRISLVDAGLVKSSQSKPLELRLVEIFDGLCDLITELQPDVLAIEQLYSHYDRPTTAILMGHARGVIYLAGAKHGLPIYPYPATLIKKTMTGNGHAPKAQMQMAVKLQLSLKTLPEPADVADALAIALTHLHTVTSSALLG